jgi:hypothetical protein
LGKAKRPCASVVVRRSVPATNTCTPLAGGAAFFLMEPLAAALGQRTLLNPTACGDWRPVVCLALGGLLCGLFWKLWNGRAFPKWTYDAPGVNFWHVFEMPLAGFIGYLPFALELHAFALLAAAVAAAAGGGGAEKRGRAGTCFAVIAGGPGGRACPARGRRAGRPAAARRRTC